jgi:hypothetical protein
VVPAVLSETIVPLTGCGVVRVAGSEELLVPVAVIRQTQPEGPGTHAPAPVALE